MRLTYSLTQILAWLEPLFTDVAHPESGWNEPRKRFVRKLILALFMSGSTLLSELVRQMPGSTSIRHRYKAADRLLGAIDLTEVAAAQLPRLAQSLDRGRGWVVAIDLSDIRKQYATKMEALASVYDGSKGEVGRGYSLITACGLRLDGAVKAQPLPLLFEVFSSAEEDFKSANVHWIDAIDRIHTVLPEATVVIDRAADSGRILSALLQARQPWPMTGRANPTAARIPA